MKEIDLIFSILSAVILFLFGLSSFSSELKLMAGEKLNKVVNFITKNRFISFIFGIFFTFILQSSAAITSLAVAFVDSGVINFKKAVAIMLGAYLGTSLTAWLISFNLSSIGPIFIILGGLLNLFPTKYKFLGKPLFFFGFIFFSLNLVSNSLSPIKESEEFIKLLLQTKNPFMGFVVGVVLTIIFQSSTVVTGLTIIFVQQGLVLPEASIPIVLGANLGTTGTALFASMAMNRTAKKAALSNTIINIIGVGFIFIILTPFTNFVLSYAPSTETLVAFAHLSFNIIIVIFFMIFLDPFVKGMNYLYKK